jgi:hypothetical protein
VGPEWGPAKNQLRGLGSGSNSKQKRSHVCSCCTTAANRLQLQLQRAHHSPLRLRLVTTAQLASSRLLRGPRCVVARPYTAMRCALCAVRCALCAVRCALCAVASGY